MSAMMTSGFSTAPHGTAATDPASLRVMQGLHQLVELPDIVVSGPMPLDDEQFTPSADPAQTGFIIGGVRL